MPAPLVIAIRVEGETVKSFDNFGDDAGADGTATLTDSKPFANFHRHGHD